MSASVLFNGISDSSYRESIEFSANFNRRLSSERRMRMPFLDPQTGVAQAHSSLFMDRRQRMPGFREGQLYSYPAARWRKSRRQYLTKTLRPFGSVGQMGQAGSGKLVTTIGGLVASRSPAGNGVGGATKRSAAAAAAVAASGNEASNTSLGDATDSNDCSGLPSFLDNQDTLSMGATSDSKDSQSLLAGAKEDLPKEWFYDDMDMHEMDALEEPKSPADDEFDYDPRYGHKKKKRRPAATKRSSGGGGGGHSGGGGGGGHSKGGPRRSAGGASGGDGSTPKPRGSSARRKSSKKAAASLTPSSPTSIVEPPSFEMAAAAVHGVPSLGVDDQLGGYRKYL